MVSCLSVVALDWVDLTNVTCNIHKFSMHPVFSSSTNLESKLIDFSSSLSVSKYIVSFGNLQPLAVILPVS